MSCPGLHCAGCAGGAIVPLVPLAAAFGLAWVAEHIVEVAAVSAVCGVLAVAAVVALARWSDRHAARVWAQRPAELRARVVPAVLPPAGAPAIGPVYNFNLYVADAAEAAAVIRRAIPGTAEDVTTEGK